MPTPSVPEPPEFREVLPHEVVDDAPVAERAQRTSRSEPFLRLGPLVLAVVVGLVALIVERLGVSVAVGSAYPGRSGASPLVAALVVLMVAPPLAVSLVYTLMAAGTKPMHVRGILVAVVFTIALSAVSLALIPRSGIPVGRVLTSMLLSLLPAVGAAVAGGLLGDAIRKREPAVGAAALGECALAALAACGLALHGTVGMGGAFGAVQTALATAAVLSGLTAGLATRGSRLTPISIGFACLLCATTQWGLTLTPIPVGTNARLAAALLCGLAGWAAWGVLVRRRGDAEDLLRA